MKLKALAAVAVLAFAGASLAAAAPPTTNTHAATPPTDKGKPSTTGTGCKPNIAVILTGKLAGDGGTAPFSLSVNVTNANHFALAFKKTTAAIQITNSTKVHRLDDTNPAHLKSGDRVNIQARACKADTTSGTTLNVIASRVTAQPAKA